MQTIPMLKIVALLVLSIVGISLAIVEDPLEKTYDRILLEVMAQHGFSSVEEALLQSPELLNIDRQMDKIRFSEQLIHSSTAHPVPPHATRQEELKDLLDSVHIWRENVWDEMTQMEFAIHRNTTQL